MSLVSISTGTPHLAAWAEDELDELELFDIDELDALEVDELLDALLTLDELSVLEELDELTGGELELPLPPPPQAASIKQEIVDATDVIRLNRKCSVDERHLNKVTPWTKDIDRSCNLNSGTPR